MVTDAEHICVVDEVINIVKSFSDTITVIEWPSIIVGRIETAAEAAEQCCHGQVGYSVSIVKRRIKNNRQ